MRRRERSKKQKTVRPEGEADLGEKGVEREVESEGNERKEGN